MTHDACSGDRHFTYGADPLQHFFESTGNFNHGVEIINSGHSLDRMHIAINLFNNDRSLGSSRQLGQQLLGVSHDILQLGKKVLEEIRVFGYCLKLNVLAFGFLGALGQRLLLGDIFDDRKKMFFAVLLPANDIIAQSYPRDPPVFMLNEELFERI